MRFLCDQMLARLGHWLRAAGYDTKIVDQSLADRDILALARAEKRILLTRDRHFLEMKHNQGEIIWLKANGLEGCVQELTQKAHINWIQDLFSRCLDCNEELIEADSDALKQVPPRILAEHQQFWFCRHCNKVYWEGSHTQRMRQKLQRWSNQ